MGKFINFTFYFYSFLCLISINEVFSQNPEAKRSNIWYFGNGAGLDFSNGSPISLTDGQIDSWESCASICDINGNLLFYTDGDTIWNRNHNIMPNGTGLYGNCFPGIANNSATQGVIIIPQPKSQNIFYVFTVDCAENLGQKGMNYSIVDLNLDSGLGDVTIKNQFLFAPSTEGMAATMNCTRDSIWVLGHEFGTSTFYAYLINENGLNATPVISNIGNNVMNYEGQMKFSPNGKKAMYYGQLFNFDFSLGVLSNPTLITNSYGVSFSPNSNYLYIIVSANTIYQFDITYNNSIDILNSSQILYQGLSNNEYWGLQLANDYKIYIAATDTNKISKIDSPDNNGISAGFSPYSIDLNGRKSQFTLPSFIESYFNKAVNYECQEELVIPNVFSPNGDGINDLFYIKGLQKGDKILIYNRWGIKVYEFTNITDGWDGRTNAGEKCSVGVYYYIIKREDYKDQSTENTKGFIHLFY